MRCITLYGRKRVGKNTVANAIRQYVDQHKMSWKIKEASFAKPLRQILGILYDIPDEFLYDDSSKDRVVDVTWEEVNIDSDGEQGNMTFRRLLQIFGTDLMRKQWSKNIWSSIPFRKDYPDHTLVLITDARFENELRMSREHQGINIHIVRPGQKQEDTHASENQEIPQELFDFTIIGKEGVPALTKQVHDLLTENFERILG